MVEAGDAAACLLPAGGALLAAEERLLGALEPVGGLGEVPGVGQQRGLRLVRDEGLALGGEGRDAEVDADRAGGLLGACETRGQVHLDLAHSTEAYQRWPARETVTDWTTAVPRSICRTSVRAESCSRTSPKVGRRSRRRVENRMVGFVTMWCR